MNIQCELDRAGDILRGLHLTDNWMNFAPGHQLSFKFHLLFFHTYCRPLKADADARQRGTVERSSSLSAQWARQHGNHLTFSQAVPPQ